jgi:hypothetical protein
MAINSGSIGVLLEVSGANSDHPEARGALKCFTTQV